MTKLSFLLGISLILFKLAVGSKNESFVNTCQVDQIFEQLRNSPLNVTSLTFVCNNTADLSIKSIIFPTNTTLQSLTFRGFNFEIFPYAFQNLFNLKNLRFQNCHFLYIHKDAFGGLDQLRELDLSSNNITTFNQLWISSSLRLNYLNLSHNSITHFSEQSYNLLRNAVNVINLRKNNLQCHCINQWISKSNILKGHLIIDKQRCAILPMCSEQLVLQPMNNVTAFAFKNITIYCPIITSSPLVTHFHWISPQNDVFTTDNEVYRGLRANARITIQPRFLETTIHVNDTSLTITYFRGSFAGIWTCIGVSQSGYSMSGTVVINGRARLRAIFDFSVMVGFTFAGCWLVLAIAVGLVQYWRETSCCRHRIDYNKSAMYAKTVIPVPLTEEDSSASEESARAGHNDVQLIFTDEDLANQYVQMLTDLKDASQVADENFNNRLLDVRARFSADFSRMRVDIKRGMESLRSNSTAAAHKLRRSVVHIKDHMRSFTEFCGSASIAQSISIVVISDNGNNHNDQIEERPRKHTVFNFFEPC